MKNAQLYCTLDELITDLNLNGIQPRLFDRIQAASRFINRRFGNFIPMVETSHFRDIGIRQLRLPSPILSIQGALNNGVAVTDYDLYPENRYWQNGPYTRIEAQSFAWDEVEITGHWGMYEETASLGESVSQLVGATTITVTNGYLLSPGMVLLIGDEQELVTGVSSPTAATSVLVGDITEADEEITVTDGSEFNEGEVIQLSTEDCCIRMIRGNTLVVARGWNNTTKAAYLNGSAIYVYRSYIVERGVNGTTAAAHESAALFRYAIPEDVNWLCRQIAGLMHKKAQSGFAGKVGSAELGETFYFNEFPGQGKEIARNYRIVSL
jgi:hypothetical protein